MKTRKARGLLSAVGCLVLVATAATAGCDGDDALTPATDAAPSEAATPERDAGVADADAAAPEFTKEEEAIIKTLGPLPAVPADKTNAFADVAAAATLGQMLFFEKSYSGPIVVADDGTNGGLGAMGATGKVSCASCHGGEALEDARSKPNNTSIGIDRGPRNALALVNAAYYPWTNWGGRFDSQWSLAPAVAENPRNMASSRLAVAHMLWTKYRTEYNAVFPVPLDAALDPAAADAARFPATGKPKAAVTDPDGPWELMTAVDRTIVNTIVANYGKAIAAYERKLVSGGSALDRFVGGDANALSADARRGLKVFIGKGKCVSCHSGPTLSDGKFHALLVPQTGVGVPAADLGRFTDVPPLLASPFNTNGAFSDDKTTGKLTGLAQDAAQQGQFRTPTLRNIAKSGPYMHAGQLATLDAVVAFYATGGGSAGDAGVVKDPALLPLTLVGTDAADLVAFMKALTGAAIPADLLRDTAKP